MMSRKIDWKKTNNNILGKLLEYGKKGDYASIMHLSPNRMYEIFDKRIPKVDELSLYSQILGIPMEELIVYEDDKYYSYDIEVLQKQKDDSSAEERREKIEARIRSNQSSYASLEIRNLKEFLMYLPLIPPSLLCDCLSRIFGDYEHNNNNYIRKNVNYLYHNIPSSSVKEYIDWYRDTYIQTKGDRYSHLLEDSPEYDSDELKNKDNLFEEYYALISAWMFQKEYGSYLGNKRQAAIDLYEEVYNQAIEMQKNK